MTSIAVKALFVVLFVIVSFWAVHAAQAQEMTCDYYPALAERLATQYGEMPLERGLDWRGNMMEWWGNPETGTWSLVTFNADGIACIPAHGEMYEAIEPAALGVDG